jgi:hypothetical protein
MHPSSGRSGPYSPSPPLLLQAIPEARRRVRDCSDLHGLLDCRYALSFYTRIRISMDPGNVNGSALLDSLFHISSHWLSIFYLLHHCDLRHGQEAKACICVSERMG